MKRRSFLPAERADIIVDFADFAHESMGTATSSTMRITT